uniref:Carbonyl reductase [NADPH] 3 n=2 Tax=Cacopsylla melanoneura TaxID=428564 RepID=A0A8D8VMI6_9HEMI
MADLLSATPTLSFQRPVTLAPYVSPSERVAVVTGANQGLGFGIVKGLCEQFDGYIYLTARDKKKGAEALQALKDMKVCKHPEKLRFHELNVLNEEHTDDFYYHLKKEHGGIDILVNNAAIAYKVGSTVPFAEQVENTIRTNYLAVVRTCVFLFPLLRRHGRVVNLSSSAGHLSSISNYELKKRLLEDCQTEKKLTDIMYEVMDITKEHPKAHVEMGWPDSAYAISKIGVNLLTRIYQKKFDSELGDQDRVINAVHPGYVATNMSSYMGNVNIFEAAEGPLYCALLPPHIVAPRGDLVWSDLNWIDMDSPTTPETDNEIWHYDIVKDVRHYANYTTSSRLPPFDGVLEREWALMQDINMTKLKNTSPQEESDRAHEEVKKTSALTKEGVHNAQEEDQTKSVHAEIEHSTKATTTAAEKASKNKYARAEEKVLKAEAQVKTRSARAVKDSTLTPSSLSYRTMTRPTLPEEWLSHVMAEDSRKRRETTLPGC